ncbi:MAG TPA: hypothetical protein VFK60_01735 [Casimicrobiaceae bacterium]|nr:hypothetical protein [Casimicrobiaceae bacterium]
MNCASCGAENAADARYCARCGAEQPRAAPRRARGATIAIVASCVVVLLAGYGGWKLMTGAWSGSEAPVPQPKVVQVPAGNVPPPTDQSAAPLPPPSALPAGDDVAPESASAASSATAASAASAPSGARATTGPRVITPTPAQRPRSAARAHAEASAKAPAKAPVPAAAPVERMATAAPSAPQADDHWTKMNDDLSRCTREDFINRVICDQRVRIRYCDGYWGKVAQCPVSPSTQEVR